jgi:hypothetical protein
MGSEIVGRIHLIQERSQWRDIVLIYPLTTLSVFKIDGVYDGMSKECGAIGGIKIGKGNRITVDRR